MGRLQGILGTQYLIPKITYVPVSHASFWPGFPGFLSHIPFKNMDPSVEPEDDLGGLEFTAWA